MRKVNEATFNSLYQSEKDAPKLVHNAAREQVDKMTNTLRALLMEKCFAVCRGAADAVRCSSRSIVALLRRPVLSCCKNEIVLTVGPTRMSVDGSSMSPRWVEPDALALSSPTAQ